MVRKDLIERYNNINKKHEALKKETDATLCRFDKISLEALRVVEECQKMAETYTDLDLDFERKTSLNSQDVKFLFLATALQCIRIYLINKFTKRERAIESDLEKKLKKSFKERYKKVNGLDEIDAMYFASTYRIINNLKVPYDVTRFNIPREKRTGPTMFSGANHRFATLGHDPVLGFFFGTGNILTNTITIVDKPFDFRKINTVFNLATIDSYHISYIGTEPEIDLINNCSTLLVLEKCVERFKSDKDAVTYAIIKQAYHIASDLYTICGIQIPFANLVLDKMDTEKFTKYISTGDLLKAGAGATLSIFINYCISVLHNLLYDESLNISQKVYSAKTKQIVMDSNLLASTSNVIWTAGRMCAGDGTAIKDLDIGGLMVTLYRLFYDTEFIRQVKYEFILSGLTDRVKGISIES